jgi:hypothetical protein
MGLESAYKGWSLTIAEDRGQPDISGVTLGVTEDAWIELPPGSWLAREKSLGIHYVASTTQVFRDSSSIPRTEYNNELKRSKRCWSFSDIACRYRPNPHVRCPRMPGAQRPFTSRRNSSASAQVTV